MGHRRQQDPATGLVAGHRSRWHPLRRHPVTTLLRSRPVRRQQHPLGFVGDDRRQHTDLLQWRQRLLRRLQTHRRTIWPVRPDPHGNRRLQRRVAPCAHATGTNPASPHRPQGSLALADSQRHLRPVDARLVRTLRPHPGPGLGAQRFDYHTADGRGVQPHVPAAR